MYEEIEELLRQNLRLQRKLLLMKIFCAVALTTVFLNGFDRRRQEREVFQMTEYLMKAEARIADQAETCSNCEDRDQQLRQWQLAELHLADAKLKMITTHKDYQKILSDFDRTQQAYEAACQKEHEVVAEPPGLPQGDPRYLVGRSPQN